MNIQFLMYVFSTLLIIFLLENSNSIQSLKVAIISNSDKRIDALILKTFLKPYDKILEKPIDLIVLNQTESQTNICRNDREFPLIFNTLVNREFNVIITSIDSNFCELVRILTNLYKKYVITLDCKSLLLTDNDSSNYFFRLNKTYRNGIILLSELLYQMKWKSVVLFVMANNSIIEDNSSAINFISGIKRLFHESHIEIKGSLVLYEHHLNDSYSNLTQLMSTNIKCAVIIATNSQTPTVLRHLKQINDLMDQDSSNNSNSSNKPKLLQIYLTLDTLSKQMFKLIEQSVNQSIGPKLVVIPSLNINDRQSHINHSTDINVTKENSRQLYTETTQILVSINKCFNSGSDECQNLLDKNNSNKSQTLSGHILVNRVFGRKSHQYSVYCINCTKIKSITKLNINYNSYEIDINNLIDLPEPDAQCLFNDTECQFHTENDRKIKTLIAERITAFSKELLVLSLFLFTMLAFLFSVMTVRKKREENQILRNIILSTTDLELNDLNNSSYNSTSSSVTSISKSNSMLKLTAKLRGEIVQIKPIIHKSGSQMSAHISQDLRPKAIRHLLRLYRLKDDNLTKFMCLIHNSAQTDFSYGFSWEYCSRGSLAQVIAKTEIKLDWNFKISLIADIIRGMRYLHDSPVEIHGYLNSNNCVIDSRWLLKITNFGLNKFREIQSLNSTECFDINDLLWFAPELLRLNQPFWYCSQKADVYSFAIVLQELLLRDKPFSTYRQLSTVDIIDRVKYGEPQLRPELMSIEPKHQTENPIPKDMIKLINKCWSEDPEERPGFERLCDEFKKFIGERYLTDKNIVDTMLMKIEKYSNNLEELVEERTIKLEEERKRAETLLYRMLPISVAENLKNGVPVQPEKFDDVTVFFSDIIGFTTIASYSDPLEVITILNDLYLAFDEIINEFNIYKVETIGDAYMVVSGLPQRNSDHAEQIASMALEILHFCVKFKIRHMPSIPLQLRCGIHSGPVVGGVVGNTNPRYCLFGDTVNIASRLESTGISYRIHISKSTEEKLRPTGEYIIQYRGEITLKGRGKQPTYYLLGKVGFDKELPEPIQNEREENHGIHDEGIFTSLGLKKQLF